MVHQTLCFNGVIWHTCTLFSSCQVADHNGRLLTSDLGQHQLLWSCTFQNHIILKSMHCMGQCNKPLRIRLHFSQNLGGSVALFSYHSACCKLDQCQAMSLIFILFLLFFKRSFVLKSENQHKCQVLLRMRLGSMPVWFQILFCFSFFLQQQGQKTGR